MPEAEVTVTKYYPLPDEQSPLKRTHNYSLETADLTIPLHDKWYREIKFKKHDSSGKSSEPIEMAVLFRLPEDVKDDQVKYSSSITPGTTKEFEITESDGVRTIIEVKHKPLRESLPLSHFDGRLAIE